MTLQSAMLQKGKCVAFINLGSASSTAVSINVFKKSLTSSWWADVFFICLQHSTLYCKSLQPINLKCAFIQKKIRLAIKNSMGKSQKINKKFDCNKQNSMGKIRKENKRLELFIQQGRVFRDSHSVHKQAFFISNQLFSFN